MVSGGDGEGGGVGRNGNLDWIREVWFGHAPISPSPVSTLRYRKCSVIYHIHVHVHVYYVQCIWPYIPVYTCTCIIIHMFTNIYVGIYMYFVCTVYACV